MSLTQPNRIRFLVRKFSDPTTWNSILTWAKLRDEQQSLVHELLNRGPEPTDPRYKRIWDDRDRKREQAASLADNAQRQLDELRADYADLESLALERSLVVPCFPVHAPNEYEANQLAAQIRLAAAELMKAANMIPGNEKPPDQPTTGDSNLDSDNESSPYRVQFWIPVLNAGKHRSTHNELKRLAALSPPMARMESDGLRWRLRLSYLSTAQRDALKRQEEKLQLAATAKPKKKKQPPQQSNRAMK